MKLQDLFESEQKLIEVLNGCKPYLSLPGSKDGMLFRGLRLSPNVDYSFDAATGLNWTILKAQRNRSPSDTPLAYSTLADKVLKEKFNWSPRAEGTFVTGKLRVSREYGAPHVIIPIGPTRFVWSPKVRDMFNWLTQELGLYVSMSKLAEEERHKLFIAELKKADYKDTDLGAGIRSGHEIMLDCDRYLAIRCDSAETSTMVAIYKLTGIDSD